VKSPRTWLVALGAIALIAIGFFFVRGPKPIIEIKGEELAKLGPLPILNTWVAGVLAVIVILTLAYLGTRKLNLIPAGFQNAVEAVAEALYNLCVATAGEKHGRRFFPVAATIFVFIWIANWLALTPIFNSFGAIQEVSPHHFHHEAQVFDDIGGVGLIMPFQLGGDSPLVEFHVDEEALAELEQAKKDAQGHTGEGAEGSEEAVEAIEHEIEALYAAAIVEGLHEKHLVPEEITEYEEAIAYLEEDGKKLGVLFPYFRSMNTDLNSPLSFAIIAVIFIEFWGITGLGLFKYGSKFINFSSPINFFVGFLELVAEVARIISFTFRLFGNMLAGEILLLVMTFLVPFLIALPFYGLETFVGVIQAFVFFSLTVAFGALAVAEHGEHDGEAEGEHGLVAAEYGSDAVAAPHGAH